MSETQNIEYKSSWRDEYLKWICGFANAQGGVLVIGKDDNGNVVGIKNARKLLEELPNKITNVLGIVAAVDLHETKRGAYIEIAVDPQPNPVSHKGEYHFRSGTTKQELKGAALNKFLLQKHGRKWDSVLVPNVKTVELKRETVEFFKDRGIESNRLSEKCRKDTLEQLLENLNLIENGSLKRAALLLFHSNPEKFATGAYIKIGFFHTDSDLRFQDDIRGNLFEQVERAMELLLTKYTKALIDYRGLSRIEKHEYPKDALREALLNAVTHKEYSGGAPIQIRVYNDKIMIWNEGRLPENWTIENLMRSHSSRPNNPDIANAFFRSGYVESWGRGISKIEEQCAIAGLPAPTFTVDGADFWVVFRKSAANVGDTVIDTVIDTQNDTVNDTASDTVSNTESDTVKLTNVQRKILYNITKNPHVTSNDLAAAIGINAVNIRKNIAKLKAIKLIERVGTDKDGYWKTSTRDTVTDTRNDTVIDTLNDTVNDTVNDTASDTVSDTERDTVTLTNIRRKILNSIIKNPRVTSNELAEIVGISAVNIRKNIARLKAAKLVERIGTDRDGYWKTSVK